MNGHLGGTQNTLHIIALSRLAPPAKILDMGAGAGETVGLLRDMGYDARGIDIRPGNDMVEKGDFLRCPYPDAAFDGIISQCAFFVGGDVSGAFSEAYRLLKGGGYSGGDCGCMSGGACLISYITGKGGENDADLPGHVSALCHFTHWFAEEMKERYGGTDCGEILGGDQRRKMERCPEIMALSFEKCIEILSGKGLI